MLFFIQHCHSFTNNIVQYQVDVTNKLKVSKGMAVMIMRWETQVESGKKKKKNWKGSEVGVIINLTPFVSSQVYLRTLGTQMLISVRVFGKRGCKEQETPSLLFCISTSFTTPSKFQHQLNSFYVLTLSHPPYSSTSNSFFSIPFSLTKVSFT